MQTNSCRLGVWIALAMLLAPGAARSAEGAPVSEPDNPAHVERLVPVFRVAPKYPRRALSMRTTGFVEFAVTVNPDGTVRDLRVIRSEPPGVFDAGASKALWRWKFKPKIVDGQAVESAGTQLINFEMHDARKPGEREACEKLRKPARMPRAMRESRIERVEAALKLVSEADLAGAESALVELLGSARNDYERAVALQALGYVYVKQQKDDKAISSYEQAVATNTLSWSSHDEITFALAKLYLINGKQEQGMQLLDAYLREACAPQADAQALKQRLTTPTPAPTPSP